MREGVGEAAENPLNQMKRSYQRYKGHLGAGAAVDAAAQGGAAPLFIAEQQGCREAPRRGEVTALTMLCGRASGCALAQGVRAAAESCEAMSEHRYTRA